MKTACGASFVGLCVAGSLAGTLCEQAAAQQLEPRAYAPSPVGLNLAGIAAGHSSGDVVLDPSIPIEGAQASVTLAVPFYARSFDLLGRQAGVSVAFPFADFKANGEVQGEARSVRRTGPGDPVLRFAVNLLGSPALTPQQFASRSRETIVGASLSVVAPLGEYDSRYLLNLGTNRWAFKPELAVSQPVGNWDLELYSGVWLFTDNEDFYGGQVREQAPMLSTQAHAVYNVRPGLWASLDLTYYAGGETTVGGRTKQDRSENTRAGLTVAVPVTRHQSLKLAWSRGVSVRIGQNFTTFGATWAYAWF